MTTIFNSTVNQSPDPGQPGTQAVAGITSNGHSSTLTQASANAPGGFSSDSDGQSRSARWSAFAPASGYGGQIIGIRLKFTWSAIGSASADDGGGGGVANSSCSFSIGYSLNGGAGWTNVASDSAFAFAPGGGGDNINNSGSADIVIPPNTPINQIQVRDFMQANASTTSGEFLDASAQSDISVSISGLRLEIETLILRPFVIM